MSDLVWLVRDLRELPRSVEWLGPAEQERLSKLRFPRRRRDFRLGRFAAKSAVARFLGVDPDPDTLAGLEICNDSEGAPHVRWGARPPPCAISLSHRSGRALATATHRDSAVGCDLERAEPRSPGFVSQFLAEEERTWVETFSEPDRSCVATLLWSGKESALKAVGTGLDVDTRDVVVRLGARCPGEWSPLTVELRASDRVLPGWWWSRGGWLMTLVADEPMPRPARLDESDSG